MSTNQCFGILNHSSILRNRIVRTAFGDDGDNNSRGARAEEIDDEQYLVAAAPTAVAVAVAVAGIRLAGASFVVIIIFRQINPPGNPYEFIE